MDIVDIAPANRQQELIDALVDIWEGSVRATHDFLAPGELERLKAMVPDAFKGIPTLSVCMRDEKPVAFIGLDGQFVEMLFVDASCRGMGIGKQLLTHAVDAFGANEVSVNEENPQAVGFYEHMGFVTYRRTDVDGEGAPHPLLYMKR